MKTKTENKLDFESCKKLLAYVQSNLNAPKNLYNLFGKYHYRNAEGILEGVKECLKDVDGAVVLCTDEIKAVGQFTFVEAEAIISYKETSIGSKAQAGIPESRKGMDLAQVFGASSSYARKYALNGLFAIDDVKDADSQAPTSSTNKDEDSRVWLNKGTPEFERALKYIKEGGTVKHIEVKYKLSKAVKELLTK